jgi:hypothetical protein
MNWAVKVLLRRVLSVCVAHNPRSWQPSRQQGCSNAALQTSSASTPHPPGVTWRPEYPFCKLQQPNRNTVPCGEITTTNLASQLSRIQCPTVTSTNPLSDLFRVQSSSLLAQDRPSIFPNIIRVSPVRFDDPARLRVRVRLRPGDRPRLIAWLRIRRLDSISTAISPRVLRQNRPPTMTQ